VVVVVDKTAPLQSAFLVEKAGVELELTSLAAAARPLLALQTLVVVVVVAQILPDRELPAAPA